jgi:predicted  nucleic acid-binding Zn-ribbon protein
VVIAESLEEKQLWRERAQLEKKVERKEKIIQNTRVRLKSGWTFGEEQTLSDEAEEIQREMNDIREEITAVDRRIRRVEREGLGSGEREAKAIELAAKEAKEFACGLEEARQRKKEAEETISELEAKLKEVVYRA